MYPCSRHRRVSRSFVLTAVGAFALSCFWPAAARAADPDIPRIQAGAERGSIQQELQLAAAYFAGHGVARDEKQAAYWYERAANSGNPSAQEQIGFFYQAGIGVDRDPARAAAWFARAMAGGSISAKVNLGVAYMWGLGVRKDPELAAKLFREAAEKGNGPAACYLGDAYYYGHGVPRDADQAKHWFGVGAKKHDAQAELSLALLLLQKPGENEEKAIGLLRDSAASGYIPAKHELALRMVRMQKFAFSPEEPLALLEEASSGGFWKSHVVLGVLYRDGRGVSKDAETAYLHFKIAAGLGGVSAANLVQNDIHLLQRQLDVSRIESLDAKASDWLSTHGQRLEFARYPGGDKDFPAFALAYPASGLHAGKLLPLSESEHLASAAYQP